MALLNRMVTKIELKLSCSGLRTADAFSASDPLVVVKQKDKAGKFHEIARTERVKNNNDPSFNKAVEIDYLFEEVQTLKFAVYDIDNDTPTTDDDDGLGKAILTLGQIVASRETTVHLSKQNPSASKPSTITIVATEITSTNEVEFVVHGSGLDKKDLLGASDPYLQLCKTDASTPMVIHQTEVIDNTTKPHWKRFSVRVQTLCNGDLDRPVLFRVFDHDDDGDHDLIGEFEAPLSAFLGEDSSSQAHELINPKKKAKKKNYKNSGKLHFLECKIVKRYSFLDYVFGGCQIHFTCGIDFTGSNGNPRESSSLHYIGSGCYNEYVMALQAVGWVIQDYDSDKLFPAFGFGAKLPPHDNVSHEFALNFNPQNPYCSGVEGILGAYYNAIQHVQLWGPTNIAPIINHVARFAAQAQASGLATGYFILLLITDGVVTDMDEAREAIVHASTLPMSIIIIGVGNADFQAMEFLDSDKGLLKAPSGSKAKRDIVQFVPFRKFSKLSPAALASNVLAEVPRQLVGYYSKNGIPPGAARATQSFGS